MIKTWQERLVGNRADTAMQSEIADLRCALLEYRQAFYKQDYDHKIEYDTLKEDFEALEGENQRLLERYT